MQCFILGLYHEYSISRRKYRYPPQNDSAVETDSADNTYLEEYDLDEYIVTANRMNMKKKDVAADTVVIDEETIERGNYSRVSEALQESGINVVSKPGASHPIINGDSRVLVLVNGRKMQYDHLMISGVGGAGIDIDALPMDNVARIEIVRGPNSSLYGNKAMGGVINIITKAPDEGSRVTLNTEFGTWNHRKNSIVAEGGDSDLRYMLTASKEKRDNYDYHNDKYGDREFPNTSIDRTTETLRLDKKVGDDTLTFEFANQERDEGYSTYIKDLAQNTAYNNGVKQEHTERSFALTYNFDGQLGKTDDYVRIYHNQDKSDSGYEGSVYMHDLKTWGVDMQKGWEMKNNKLITGASYEHDSIWEANGTTQKVDELDKSTSISSIFAEDHWNLKNGWSLNFGSRLEHHADFGTDVTSHIGLNKELSPITNAYLSWGQAVNNPTLKMRYANTKFWAANPDLKQEKAQTITLGFNSQITPNTLLEGSVYTSKVKNALEWVSDVAEPIVGSTDLRGVYENIAEEKRRGMELSLSHVLSDQWKVRAGYSYSKIEAKDNNGSFVNWDENNRPNGYLLGVSYTQDKWNGDLTLERVTGRSEQQFSNSSYTTLDLGVNYQASDDLKLYLKGYNLTNEAYEVFAHKDPDKSVYAMPGRYFVFGAEYSF